MLKRKQNKKKKGFTLIELIVVLAVLAIIALIAIPNFNQIRENSKVKSDERGADHIKKAITLLVQDSTISNDTAAAGLGNSRTFIFDGSISSIESSKLTADELTAVKDVLTNTAGPQSAASKTGGANVFKIEIKALDTPHPTVDVTIEAKQ